jgi:hypothetical protein
MAGDSQSFCARAVMKAVAQHGPRIRGFHLIIAIDNGDGTQDQAVYRDWDNRTHLIGSLMNAIRSIQEADPDLPAQKLP